MRRILAAIIFLGLVSVLFGTSAGDDLEQGWRNPPPDARPHAYWLWLNGYVNTAAAKDELRAMKDAGFGGVLLFDMGARGDKGTVPPAGPAFLSPPWMAQFKELVSEANTLGLQVDFSVVSSWDMGGHWIQPEHASMGLFATETSVAGGAAVDVTLPFPPVPAAAPKGPDGRPAFWKDTAVLAVPSARRAAGHDFVFKLDVAGDSELSHVILDQGVTGGASPPVAMSPVNEFSVAVSNSPGDASFREVLRGALENRPGPQRFALPAGTRGHYARLRLVSAHDRGSAHWTLGEFALYDAAGVNVAASHEADRARSGATIVRGSAAYGSAGVWNLGNIHDGETAGPRGIFASGGPPPFALASAKEAVIVTSHVDRQGRLRWNAPAGEWTIIRYVVMNTGERLKVPSPNSDGWATDHFSAAATRAHMEHVATRLREAFPDLSKSGLRNLYLASYEVVGLVWSPGFLTDFERLRGYDMTPYLPVIFGGTIGNEETTARFLFDYRKTLSDVLISAYYRAASETAKRAGLGIKSEAGGPGPPIHNVPVDSLLANSAVDEIQGEFWPFRPEAQSLWVVKETASAGHLYGKRRVHMEAFTSTHHWYEGPQDLKESADRVFCEGANHMVWHTWSHAPPDAGKPGWVYGAGSHINRNITWWPKAKPFVDYLARSSFLLQRGNFVGDVLFYYGDGGYKFVPPRAPQPGLGAGYDYDFVNSDAILNRLTVRSGRFTLPDGTSYAALVWPEEAEAHPAVLEKMEQLIAAGGTMIGPKPVRAGGLEGYPASDARVRAAAARIWGDLDGKSRTSRDMGKGRVVWGRSPAEVLREMKIASDFDAPAALDYTHRRDGAADIYFVRNKLSAPFAGKAQFRVKGRQPELWDPVSGRIQDAPAWQTTADGTEVELDFDRYGSTFVIFRRETATRSAARQKGAELPRPLAIEGDWTVDFDGGPQALRMPQLGSWAKHANEGVRHFAGSAKYRTQFTLPSGWRSRAREVLLDLGDLWTIAEVWLNGEPLGVAWTRPFAVDATKALKDGTNELVVEVINTWHNRLVGDAKLPAAERRTRTNITVSASKAWRELELRDSGLFGPVRLMAVE